MAKFGPDDLGLLLDGRNISQDSIDATVEEEALLEQSNGWGDTWVEQTALGVKQGNLSWNGFYDDVAGATKDVLNDAEVGAAGVACITLGTAQGAEFIGAAGLKSSVARSAARDALVKYSLNLQGATVEAGDVLEPEGAQSGAGATSSGSLDNSAASTNGGAGYLQVTDLTLGGYTSVTVKIQESSDDGVGDAWTDIITFTAVTAADVAERIAIAAGTTVERYLRVTLTWNGAGSGESITMWCGFARSK